MQDIAMLTIKAYDKEKFSKTALDNENWKKSFGHVYTPHILYVIYDICRLFLNISFVIWNQIIYARR